MLRTSDRLSLLAGLALAACAATTPPAPVAAEPVVVAPAPVEVPEPVVVPVAPVEPSVTIAAVGDVTLGGYFEPHLDGLIAAGTPADEALRYGMAHVRDVLAGADLALANLEGTFAQASPRAAWPYAFKARPALAGVLVDGGIDVVALGNNHTMDFGPGGVVETLDALDAAGVGWSGAGRDTAEARRPWTTTVAGLSLAFLSYKVTGKHDVRQAASGVVFRAAGPTVAWCHFDWPCIRDMVEHDVAAAAATHDVVVVSFHWGQEKKYTPDAYQVALGHLAIDRGAAVVFGSHPHVVQGVERRGSGVIFYSLGNFLFGGNPEPFDPIGAIAVVRLGKGGVAHAELIPVRTTSATAPYQPIPLAEPERSAALRAIATRSAAFPQTLDQLSER